MSYRPITDIWILARPKVKYHGAFPSGFLARARALLCRIDEPLLHVCGGKVKEYPFGGLGPHDVTIDLDPDLKPDFVMDVRKLGAFSGCLFPSRGPLANRISTVSDAPSDFDRDVLLAVPEDDLWPAALIDRPYTPEDADHYAPGRDALPDLNNLLRRTLSVVRSGGRVGVLDYLWPKPPDSARCIACVGVVVGFNNRMRVYSVFERVAP